MKFKVEKVANMIFVTSECGVIFKAWSEDNFTEKKLKNAMTKISNDLNGNAEFVRTF